MISVVTYLWEETGFSEPRGFSADQVNELAGAVADNLTYPHRFICITDESYLFSKQVEILPLPASARAAASIPTAMGKARFPSCYRRLWTFSAEAMMLGEIVLLLDVDCFITGSLDPLFDYKPEADFVAWNPVKAWGKTKVGGGTWRLRTGTRPEIWRKLSVNETRRIKKLGYNGSDQALLSYYLADEPSFPHDWILNRQDMRRYGGKIPSKAKIVHCNGPAYMKKFSNVDDVPWV